MQSNKISFKGQNIYVGIDVHLKTWHVTTLTESGYKYSFAQHADTKELFDRLNKKFPGLSNMGVLHSRPTMWRSLMSG